MTRTIQPHEILVSALILLGALMGTGGAGYWAGHRGMDEIRFHDDQATYAFRELYEDARGQGLFDQENPIRINVECHNDASDWAAVEMANEVGWDFDLPVYVHGNCMTHQVVDVDKADTKTFYLFSTTTSDPPHFHAIVNDPLPEGR